MDSHQHSFTCPVGNHKESLNYFDVVVAGDFSLQNKNLAGLIEYVRSKCKDGVTLALFHWPDYRSLETSTISNDVFAMCLDLNVTFVEPWNRVYVTTVYLFDKNLLTWEPDGLPWNGGLDKVAVFEASPNINS